MKNRNKIKPLSNHAAKENEVLLDANGYQDHKPNRQVTRVRGLTRSVSAQRWEGDGLDARPISA